MKNFVILSALLVSSICFGQSYKLTKKEYKSITSDKRYKEFIKKIPKKEKQEQILIFEKCMSKKYKIPFKKYFFEDIKPTEKQILEYGKNYVEICTVEIYGE